MTGAGAVNPREGARSVLISGAGIAGPVAAVALQQAGFEPVLCEAYEEGAEGVGAFLGLGINGIDALRAVGMDAAVLARGFATPRMVITNGGGKVLADFPNGGTLPDGTRAITISRPALYAALKEEAVRRGIPIEYGRRLVDAQIVSGGVRASFADGSSARAALLVGADGIRSVVRGIIDPHAPVPTYVGFLNTAGYAHGTHLPAQPGVNHLVFGKRAFFGYVKHPDGAVWWFANPPVRDEPDPLAIAAIPADKWRERLQQLFADDSAPALELIRRTKDVFAGWITYDMPSVPRWHNDRMVIIGDAAHAVSPSVGQGASLAIEDAVVLAKCLRDIPDIGFALAQFGMMRRARVERVAAQGRRNGQGKTVGPAGRMLRDMFMPVAMRVMFRGGRDPFAWIWNHHMEWDAPVPGSLAAEDRGAQRRPRP